MSSVRESIERLLDAVGETAARSIVTDLGKPSALQNLERVIAVRLAARLLAGHEPRAAIRDRLVSRGVSPATAYRTIGAALDQRNSALVDVATVSTHPRR